MDRVAELLRRRLLALALASVFVLLAPAAASASSAKVDKGKLVYTALAGETNHLVITPTAPGTVELAETGRLGFFPILIGTSGGGGCSGFGWKVTCTGVSSLSLALVDSDDYADTTAVALPTAVTTGNGSDRVYTGAADDNVNTHDGSDVVDGGLGNDSLTGGPGSDLYSYASHGATQPVVATLDGTQNDGCAACGENEKINSDFESVTGGSGNDTITGNATANTISGGPGADKVDGGPGDDQLAMRDATTDQLACGADSDGGDADIEDAIATDCESVTRSEAEPVADGAPDAGIAAPDGGDPAGSDDDAVAINLAPPVIPSQTAVVTRAGVALVTVACPADSGGCVGTVELQLLGGSAAEAKVVASRRRRVNIGRSRFRAQAGEKPIVRVQLNRRGRRRVLRGRRRKKRASVVVTTRGANGQVVKTSRTITLARRSVRKPPKGRKR
jgi:Ca2+-binding RTX toxin-like protein